MIKKIRKNALVRYTGNNPLMNGKTYKVIKKTGNSVLIYGHCKYLDGIIRTEKAAYPINDFQLV